MAKKTKPRSAGRPRLSDAQLQAYRARRAATMPAVPEAVDTVPVEREMPRGEYTQWGRVDEEYALIRADLVRLLIITAGMLAILAVLTVVLR